MKTSAVCVVVIAALRCVHGMFVGNMFLPFGSIMTSSGILGFKISMAASLISLVSQGILSGDFETRAGTVIAESSTGKLSGWPGLLVPNTTTSATTAQPDERAPISALQDILSVEPEQQHQMDLLFTFLKQMDDRRCLSRLVCESAAERTAPGQSGQRDRALLQQQRGAQDRSRGRCSLPPQTPGRSRGAAGCAQEFAECTADLRRVLSTAD
ncbi:hypothetical protein HPB52_006590 [Rhipicephalus sanguineus]|uniref:Uncharacterized protein n=1 Tax=Rhipicephalus sanguineus TaxID=34632 RepID=A0A9D4PUT6_RHISA|nr:hypothetical protein HPB52_006590 [Rhipicephalus sanguineus]